MLRKKFNLRLFPKSLSAVYWAMRDAKYEDICLRQAIAYFVGKLHVCQTGCCLLLCCVVLVWPVRSWADPESVIAEVEALVFAQQATGVDYAHLGDAHLERGDLDKAKKAYEKAVRLGEVVLGHNGIGKVYAQTPGRGLKAQYHFRRALGKDPHFAEAQYHLARIYTRMRPLDAEEAFAKALYMDPDHRDAHFQFGQLMEAAGDRAGALAAYERQILVNQTHGEARYRMGKLLFAQGDQAEAVRIFADLIKAGGEVGTKAYLEMALMSQMARNFDAAEKLFEKYIDQVPENEKEVFLNIALVATEEEWATFGNTPDSLKPQVVRRFWASRDPAPLTRANERLIEHYRRVAYALRNFSKGQFPWDDRGEVYVRLGDPDHVSRFNDIQIERDPYISRARERFAARIGPGFLPPVGRPMFPIDGRWEYWVYAEIDKGTEFTFENAFDDSRYSFADVPLFEGAEISAWINVQGELLLRNIAARTPSRYRADFADLPIDFYYYPAGFRSEGQKTRLELYLGLPASEVTRLNSNGQDLVVLERGMALYDSLWHEVHHVRDQLQFRAPTDQQVLAGAFIPGVLSVDLLPGTYRLSLQVRDVVSGKSQVYRQQIVLEDYGADDQLKISDIELAFAIAPSRSEGQFIKNGLQVVPMSSKAFRADQNAFVYFEIYNLSQDDFRQSRYQVEYTLRSYKERAIPARILFGLGRVMRLVEKDQQVEIAYDQVSANTDEETYVELDLREMEPGEQLVRVKVKDLLTGQEAQKEIRFKIVP